METKSISCWRASSLCAYFLPFYRHPLIQLSDDDVTDSGERVFLSWIPSSAKSESNQENAFVSLSFFWLTLSQIKMELCIKHSLLLFPIFFQFMVHQLGVHKTDRICPTSSACIQMQTSANAKPGPHNGDIWQGVGGRSEYFSKIRRFGRLKRLDRESCVGFP